MEIPSEAGGMGEPRLALSFRVGAGPVEHVGETIDISAEQLVMRSPIQLEIGLRLEITVRVPIEVSGSPFSKMKFAGRILSERAGPEGTFVYKVGIEWSRAHAY
jgi:hypothetical protein